MYSKLTWPWNHLSSWEVTKKWVYLYFVYNPASWYHPWFLSSHQCQCPPNSQWAAQREAFLIKVYPFCGKQTLAEQRDFLRLCIGGDDWRYFRKCTYWNFVLSQQLEWCLSTLNSFKNSWSLPPSENLWRQIFLSKTLDQIFPNHHLVPHVFSELLWESWTGSNRNEVHKNYER